MTARLTLTALILALLQGCAGSSGGKTSGPLADAGSTTPPSSDGAAASGSLSCPDIFSCFYNCQDGDATCEQSCVNQGTAQAQQQVSAIDQCETATSCDCTQVDSACLTCLEQACTPSYQSCGLVLSCAQIQQCGDGCADSDDACWDTCYARGTLIGSLQFYEMYECFDTAEQGSCATQCASYTDPACLTCVDTACATQIQACGVTF